MNDSDSPKAKRKRRWFQFSLRTLLVLLVASAVLLGWRVQRARMNRQREAAAERAAAEIQELGGYVVCTYKELRPATWLEELFDDPGGADDPVGVLGGGVELHAGFADTDAVLTEHLKALTHLRILDLRYTNVTDAGLKHLEGLTKLTWLDLIDTKVTDAGLEHLKRLTKLRQLWLGATNVTDAGLKHLRGLKNLESLGLDSLPKVTDAGLEHLKGLTNLEKLQLGSTNVTDAGLEHLKRLTKLKSLGLIDSKVTKEGVQKLREALPNCRMITAWEKLSSRRLPE